MVRASSGEKQHRAGPFQRILPIVGEAQLKAALRDAVEPFGCGDGRILIQPNSFKYVVAVG